MSLWMYEMKKMFLLQKGLLFIGLYFVLNLASMMVLDKPANPDIEMNASQYLAYLNQVQGPYWRKPSGSFRMKPPRFRAQRSHCKK